MDEELRFHLDSYTQELIRRGIPPDEAARRARIELGGVTTQKEKMRASLGLRLWDDLRADLRYSARTLVKSPVFTAVAIGSLALGIGANTAVFSMMRAALFTNLPVPRPAELKQLQWTIHGKDQPMNDLYNSVITHESGNIISSAFSTQAYQDLRKSRAFSDLVAFSDSGRMSISFEGDVEPGRVEYVSGNFFSALELKPQAGRTILPSDDEAPGKSSAVMLSDAFWQSRFARSPAVIGKTIEVGRIPLTIVGVAPPGFTGLSIYSRPIIFLPLSMNPILSPSERSTRLADPETWWLGVFGRIRPGVSNVQAEAATAGIFRQTVRETLKSRSMTPGGPNIDLNSMRLQVIPGSRGENPYWRDTFQTDAILGALSFLVLLLACANLANLLVARAASRQKEMSLRIALGAGRARILRQAYTESLLLALLGSIAGTALGYVSRNVVPRLLGQGHPSFDPAVFFFALGLGLFTCMLFGSLPAWRAMNADTQDGMRETTQMTARRSRARLGKSLVVIQIALSVMLVAGAGLFLQTLRNLLRVELGFQPERLLLFELSLGPQYKTQDARAAAYEQIAERLAAIPSVTSASYSTDVLIGNDTSTSNFDIDGETKRERRAWENVVGLHFFETMGIPLLSGRGFGNQDTTNTQLVAIVNEQLAHDFFPNRNPIGQTFNSGSAGSHGIRIVGVCGNTRFKDLRDTPPPTFYLFSRQIADYGPGASMTFVVKTASDPKAVASSIHRTVSAFDSDLPVYSLRTQKEQIDRTLQSERLFASLTSGFGILALVLACIGIYGIMAYTVARRTSEIGIRLALGAPRRRVMEMILSEAFGLAAIGVTAGLGATLLLTRSLETILFGLRPDDPLTFVLSGLLMLVVALAASFIPARGAARVNPIEALRHE
jgi:predicted permease